MNIINVQNICKNVYFLNLSFNSPGIVESIGNCNICEAEYGKCNHIEGLLYCGIVCQRINRKIIEVNHSALVKNPKDKRCILLKYLQMMDML